MIVATCLQKREQRTRRQIDRSEWSLLWALRLKFASDSEKVMAPAPRPTIGAFN